MKYGMIAGNGRFPVLALETARKLGDEVVAIALREEAAPEVEQLAATCYWISVSELSKLIDICKRESITELIMAGQVKHASIFSSIRPDWRLFKLLASLKDKNTDALIGGVARVLEDEGIHLVDSTLFLKPLLAGSGVLSRRKPTDEERKDIRYGRRIAATLAGMDVGQSVAICERACVAVEAMEGTDAMLRRAATLTNGRPFTVVKSSNRRKHLLYDVPVVGPETIAIMAETGATALAVDAGRTLMLDREAMVERAGALKIAIAGLDAEEDCL